jgi:hypothetical protein
MMVCMTAWTLMKKLSTTKYDNILISIKFILGVSPSDVFYKKSKS